MLLKKQPTNASQKSFEFTVPASEPSMEITMLFALPLYVRKLKIVFSFAKPSLRPLVRIISKFCRPELTILFLCIYLRIWSTKLVTNTSPLIVLASFITIFLGNIPIL